MTSRVPITRSYLDESAISSGRSVSGTTWMSLGGLANFTLGRGAQIVPAYYVQNSLTVAHEYVYKFWARPRYQAIQRMWSVIALPGTRGNTAAIEVPSGGISQTRSFSSSIDTAVPQTLIENLSAQSSAAAEFSLAITPADSMVLYSISAFDVPRASLTVDANDLGTNTSLLRPGQPITRTAIDSMIRAAADSATIGRRVSHLQWSVPVTDNGATTTSFAISESTTTPTAKFALPMPMIGRKIGRADTTATVKCRALMWAASGSAKLDLVPSSGSTTTLTVTSATPAWSSDGTFVINTVDHGDTSFTVEPRLYHSAGGVTAYCAAISIWED